MPTRSTRRRGPPRSDSASSEAAHHSVRAPIGRLMKKAHGQPTVCDDERAEARADRGREAADRAPQAHGHRATALREGRQHDRQRRRREQGRAHCLQHARGDQPADAAGQAAHRRGGDEQRHAGHEHPLAAMRVGEPAGGDQHRRIDHRVGVQHPRQVGRAGVGKAGAQRAEDRVQHGRVERDQEDGDARDPEHGPGRCGTGWRLGRGGSGWPGWRKSCLFSNVVEPRWANSAGECVVGYDEDHISGRSRSDDRNQSVECGSGNRERLNAG